MEQPETKVEEVIVEKSAPQQVTKTTKQVQAVTPPIKVEHPQQVFEKKKVIFRTYQVIWYVLGVIEVLLAFRIVLRALGANPSSGFTNLIYSLSDPFALPFSGIFGVTYAAEGAVIEWSTFVAGIVYLLVAYGLIQLFQLLKPTTPQEVEENVDNP
jgi:hypothetical protein